MCGILIVDKPEGWTSHDVVAKIRRLFHERRVGHGGTLDPMATGVLPVFIGRATRAAEFLENAEKEYVAKLKLGIVTDTQDITGSVINTCDASGITIEMFQKALSGFVGSFDQLPPMYSAIKTGGKKLYELARAGIEVERKPRRITIHKLELLSFENGEYEIFVSCSKGTYIRTLCHDIGAAMGCGAVMTALRRTRAGDFTLDMAKTMDEIIAQKEQDILIPVDRVFSGYSPCHIGAEDEKRCKNGARFPAPGLPDGLYRVYGPQNAFLMVGRTENGMMETVKSYFEVT